MFLSRTNPAQTLNLLLRFNSACLCPLLARLNNTLAGNHGNVFAMGSTCKGGWRCPDIRAYVPGRSSTEFLVGVCRPVLQILTLFQTKKCHFSHPFSDLASKIHHPFSDLAFKNYVIITLIRTATKLEFAYFSFFLPI